ncbi:MAG TPA: hypothetical protein VLW46_01180 [Candidatus Bathyarchaeia archaeon]|nr:hypothetical protein [Candidatus Bathyarchaeia archaeon]
MVANPIDCRVVLFLFRATFGAVLAMLIALSCAGCLIVPMRVRASTKGASAELREPVKLEFIQKGITTRAEVAEKLCWMDTGVNEDSLFIGRWSDSRWGVAWILVGYYAADGGWNRKWNNHDLLIQFDSAGVVQEHRVVSDKQLARELSDWAAQYQGQPLDLSQPIELRTDENQILLGSDSFERRELRGKGKHNFIIPPSQIASLSLSPVTLTPGPGSNANPDPLRIRLTFHFAKKTRGGKTLAIQTEMPTVVLIYKYVAQTRRSAMTRPRPDFMTPQGQ